MRFPFLHLKGESSIFIAEIHRPWKIALHCLSYAKKLTDKDINAQLIAIIDSENVMPGFPD
jgi:GH43 family beta-xylosidase